MGKSKIWHDMREMPANKYTEVCLLLLNERKDVYFVTYDKSDISWRDLSNYLNDNIVAWAYVDYVINL